MGRPNEQFESAQDKPVQGEAPAEILRASLFPPNPATRSDVNSTSSKATQPETNWANLAMLAAAPLAIGALTKHAPPAETLAAAKDVLGDISKLQELKAEILDGSEQLARKVTKLLPQSAEGQVRWYLGGSLPPNLLARADRITELDPTKLPWRVPLRTIEINPEARRNYLSVARTISDVDAIPLRDKPPEFPGESPSFAIGFDRMQSLRQLTPEARNIFHRKGDTELSPNHFLIDFLNLPLGLNRISSVSLGRQEVLLMDPSMLAARKFNYGLALFDRGGAAEKTSSDYRHLFDAAAALSSPAQLDQFVKTSFSLERIMRPNDLFLHRHNPAFERDFGPVIDKIIAEDPNAHWLPQLTVDSSRSIEVLNVLSRLTNDADKAAMMKFINAHPKDVERWSVVDSVETRAAMAHHVLNERPDFLARAGAGLNRAKTAEGLSEIIIGRQLLHENIAATMKVPLPRQPEHSDLMATLMHVDPDHVGDELAALNRLLPAVGAPSLRSIFSSEQAMSPGVRELLVSSSRSVDAGKMTAAQLDSFGSELHIAVNDRVVEYEPLKYREVTQAQRLAAIQEVFEKHAT